MKVHRLIWIILLLLSVSDMLYCQNSITLSKPRLELSDDNLVIQYDILNSKSGDFFDVWIEVTDVSGKEVKALSVAGDIGKDIKGGRNKKITWNLATDSIFIDENIFIEVKAEKIIITEDQAETTKTEDLAAKEDSKVQDESKMQDESKIKEVPELIDDSGVKEDTKTYSPVNNTGINDISKGNVLLSSVVLPGWGQTKTSRGKPYWLIGAAGYGCLAGSVIMTLNSRSVYNDYKTEMDPDYSNDLFEKANQRKNVSKYLAFSAAGIWAVDLIWVLATPARSSGSVDFGTGKELKIMPGFSADLYTPVVSLTVKF
jgi:hypothetical protein